MYDSIWTIKSEEQLKLEHSKKKKNHPSLPLVVDSAKTCRFQLNMAGLGQGCKIWLDWDVGSQIYPPWLDPGGNAKFQWLAAILLYPFFLSEIWLPLAGFSWKHQVPTTSS